MTTNRVHSHVEQVSKDVEYNLTESADDVFDDNFKFQVCDMLELTRDGASRENFVSSLGAALEDVGFAILINHGIDASLFEATHGEIVNLFTGTPLGRKLEFVETESRGSVRLGYFPFQQSTQLQPDLVEGWEFDRAAFRVPGGGGEQALTFWPDARFESAFRRQWQACEDLVVPVMHAMLSYFDSDVTLFDDELSPPKAVLRFNYYPSIDESMLDLREGAGRLVAHEDITLFTLLPAPMTEGLQVYHPQLDAWTRLSAPPGSIILNSGDYLKRITNNRFQSCTHRVSVPRDAALRGAPRTSFPFFVYLHEESQLQALPCFTESYYEPIRAYDFHVGVSRKFYGSDDEQPGCDT
ncbi:2OG-Fe(II) oxygenase family protein [Streptomyces virginiae]|uniref:2OG-Fe(II) oxygenase family protein n=1 Tax=Streptomyces virginiae TaxID=1961 RepID=UPI0036CF2B27